MPHLQNAIEVDWINFYYSVHLTEYGPSLCAGYAACWITKECNKLAFEKYRRSTTTSNMIEEIGNVLSGIECSSGFDWYSNFIIILFGRLTVGVNWNFVFMLWCCINLFCRSCSQSFIYTKFKSMWVDNILKKFPSVKKTLKLTISKKIMILIQVFALKINISLLLPTYWQWKHNNLVILWQPYGQNMKIFLLAASIASKRLNLTVASFMMPRGLPAKLYAYVIQHTRVVPNH